MILAHTYETGGGEADASLTINSYRDAGLTQSRLPDLLCGLFGAEVDFVLVGGRGQRAAGRLVHELPQALGVVSHRAVVIPKRRAVGGRRGLRAACGDSTVFIRGATGIKLTPDAVETRYRGGCGGSSPLRCEGTSPGFSGPPCSPPCSRASSTLKGTCDISLSNWSLPPVRCCWGRGRYRGTGCSLAPEKRREVGDPLFYRHFQGDTGIVHPLDEADRGSGHTFPKATDWEKGVPALFGVDGLLREGLYPGTQLGENLGLVPAAREGLKLSTLWP